MKSETFSDSIGYLPDAPRGIERLRALILDLALRGRLSERDSSEESGHQLIARLQADRNAVGSAETRTRALTQSSVELEERPFALPSGWTWARLDDRVSVNPDGARATSELPSNTWILDLEDVEKGTGRIVRRVTLDQRTSASSKSAFRSGDVLYGKLRPYLNKVAVSQAPGFCTTEILVLRPGGDLDSEFLALSLRASSFLNFASARVYGTKMPRLGTKDLKRAIIAVPPVAEQKRIVSRVAELMLDCDEIESSQARRARARVALGESTFRRLADSDSIDLPKAWNFVSDTIGRQLSPGIGDLEVLEALRSSILDLAIRGRLSTRRESDESVAQLLESVNAQKRRLIDEKKLKAPKPLPAIDENENPHEIPDSWQWAHLGEVGAGIQYGFTASAQFGSEGNLFLRISDIGRDGRVRWASVPRCEISEKDLARYELEDGDLLIARTGGTIGKTFLVQSPPPGAVFASYLIRVRPATDFHSPFVKLFTGTTLYWNQLRAASAGTGQPNVNGSNLAKLLIPVPPQKEQVRIVETVDRLMAICDDLQTKLNSATLLREAIADSIQLYASGGS